jgi:hypothetical protein
MRVMIRVKMPVEAGNAAVADGSLSRTMGGFMDKHKPEAAYFVADGGLRTAYFFVDMKESWELPVMAEAFFMGVKASVEVMPAMNAADLQKGLAVAGLV